MADHRRRDRPVEPAEGVRIIGADEAAEAMERGDVAPRRGGHMPRYGDRPARPPAGPKPALRFPLDSSADPAEAATVRPAKGTRYDPRPPPAWDEPITDDEPSGDPWPEESTWGGAGTGWNEPNDDVVAWSQGPTGATPVSGAPDGLAGGEAAAEPSWIDDFVGDEVDDAWDGRWDEPTGAVTWSEDAEAAGADDRDASDPGVAVVDVRDEHVAMEGGPSGPVDEPAGEADDVWTAAASSEPTDRRPRRGIFSRLTGRGAEAAEPTVKFPTGAGVTDEWTDGSVSGHQEWPEPPSDTDDEWAGAAADVDEAEETLTHDADQGEGAPADETISVSEGWTGQRAEEPEGGPAGWTGQQAEGPEGGPEQRAEGHPGGDEAWAADVGEAEADWADDDEVGAEGWTDDQVDGSEGGAEGWTDDQAGGPDGGADGWTEDQADGAQGGAEGWSDDQVGEPEGGPEGRPGRDEAWAGAVGDAEDDWVDDDDEVGADEGSADEGSADEVGADEGGADEGGAEAWTEVQPDGSEGGAEQDAEDLPGGDEARVSEVDEAEDDWVDEDDDEVGAVPAVQFDEGGGWGEPAAKVFDFADEPSGQVELPHWTEPGTGELPAVLVGEDAGPATTSGSTPAVHWRTHDSAWGNEGFDDLTEMGDEVRVGALDHDRPSDEEIYDFTELEAEVAAETSPEPAPRERRVAPARPVPPTGPPAEGGAGRNVAVATGVGLAAAAVALLAFALGPAYGVALVAVILVLATGELQTAARRAGYHPASPIGLAAAALFPLAVYWRGIEAYPLLGFITVATVLAWHLVGADGEARVVESAGVTLLGVGWIAGLGSFAALLLAQPDGVGLLTAAVVAAVAYDVGGLVVGRTMGRRPLSDASPNKTVEGLVGGVLVLLVVMVAWGLFGMAPLTDLAAVKVGLFAALAAPLGDLCESLVKRDLGVKDMGTVLPEHGGLLDRFDALLFVVPAVFYALVLFDLGPFG